MENENKNRKKCNLKFFSLKLFKTLQNLVKTPMNLLKNLHLMNFRLFHVLKSIQYYFKTIITRKIWVILCTLWAKKGDFETTIITLWGYQICRHGLLTFLTFPWDCWIVLLMFPIRLRHISDQVEILPTVLIWYQQLY